MSGKLQLAVPVYSRSLQVPTLRYRPKHQFCLFKFIASHIISSGGAAFKKHDAPPEPE